MVAPESPSATMPVAGIPPVARFGGYRATPLGLRQARSVVDAALDSDEQREWRERRGGLSDSGDPTDAGRSNHDSLDGCR
jgi:hypothetical protein